MLVLTRKKSGVVKIGNDIWLQIVRCGTNAVRLGIIAPKSVAVHRLEVLLEDGSLSIEDVPKELKITEQTVNDTTKRSPAVACVMPPR